MAMTALEALLSRRSIRRFASDPIGPEKVRCLLECACAAPSAGNERPWHFVVVDERPLLDALASIHPHAKMLLEAPLALVVCGDPTWGPLSSLYWEEDCAAAMENLHIAAVALGLGSVWIGVHPLPEIEEAVRSLLSLPSRLCVLGLAAVGTPLERKDPHSGCEEGRIHFNGW